MKLGFIGLGKLGMPCAEVMAQKYTVYGYDIMPKKSENIFQIYCHIEVPQRVRKLCIICRFVKKDHLIFNSYLT